MAKIERQSGGARRVHGAGEPAVSRPAAAHVAPVERGARAEHGADARDADETRARHLRLLPAPPSSAEPVMAEARAPLRAHALRAEEACAVDRRGGYALRGLEERLAHVEARLEYLGRDDARGRIGRTRLAMLAPALAAELHDVRAGMSSFWEHRVSRANLAGPRGELSTRALDETLRTEASSFWLVSDVPASVHAALAAHPPSVQLATLLRAVLLRFASNAERLFVGDHVRVALWRDHTPYHLDVPVAWLSRPGPEVVRALADLLARFELDPVVPGAPRGEPLPPSTALPASARARLAAEAYGPWGRHGDATKALLDADLALVLDASPSAAALDARLFDPTSEAVTGGARMKEVTVVALEPGPGGAPVLSAVARRVGHAWWDGLDASEHLAADLSSLAETPPAPHAAARGLTLRGVGADRLARDPTWTCLLDAASDRAPLLPQEWSGARAVGGDLVGWTGGPQDSVSWLARVTRLRAPGHDGEGLELTLPDVYTKAHMLAAGARHVHTLVSRGDAGSPSLDIAFDVLPRSVLVAFDAFARHAEARGVRGAADVTPELWASFEAEHGGLVRRIGQRLARGVGQHYLEKQRARRGESTAAFFSALAHHDRRVEGLFKVVSRTRALVGEEMTRAISQPSGMVSNTASSRGVAARCDDDRPRLRAFYTAASDAYRPARAEELRDVWAGELGIGERPGVGHVLTLRLLPDQVWPQIEAAIDGLGLPPRDRDAARAALARWAEAKTRDPAALGSDLERSGLAPLAPVIARAVTAAVEARITEQLRRTELAVVFVLGALERR